MRWLGLVKLLWVLFYFSVRDRSKRSYEIRVSKIAVGSFLAEKDSQKGVLRKWGFEFGLLPIESVPDKSI